MVVAAEEARFGVNGVSSGLFCSTPMVALSRSIGRKKCIELLTTGRLMDAREAHLAGLVNHVVAADELEAKTLELARMVAEKSAAVVALGKRAFYRQIEMSMEDAYAYTRGVIVENLMMHDSEEGICAFVEKRKPEWKDK
jgi:enoyl-CoA hydratase/carnithine racemase